MGNEIAYLMPTKIQKNFLGQGGAAPYNPRHGARPLRTRPASTLLRDFPLHNILQHKTRIGLHVGLPYKLFVNQTLVLLLCTIGAYSSGIWGKVITF